MEQTINLTREQKAKLRQIYAQYIHSEDNFEQEQIKLDVREKFPVLKGLFMFELPELIFTPNQLQFIDDAEQSCYSVNYGYSGRGMYGDVCPSIVCDSPNDFKTDATTQSDSMGLSVVIYAQY